MKLAVGVRDVAHLRDMQAMRATARPPLRHLTRNTPRRTAEIVAGGSIYWVVAGVLLVRQRVLDVVEDCWDDATRCAGLLLDASLVQIEGRPVKAFQGWRYLEPAEAPPDLQAGDLDDAAMPPALRNQLRALCLI